MRKTLALLLAGGVGSRLNILAQVRAKPAVPFGGIYRIIDFTLSNVMNSGIENVGILTQYKPYSLMKHIGTGVPWDFIGPNRGAKILPPKTGSKDSDWYQGTADAVAQNQDYIARHNSERVLILSGDHIYYMNYAELIQFHKEKKANLTIATMDIPLQNASEFGIAVTDNNHKIIDWEEKPKKPGSTLASMGIYVFNTEFLTHCLNNRSGNDFGKNIIPWIIDKYAAYAFPFKGYWQDVGTVRALWEANMDLLDDSSGLNIEDWGICTNIEEEGSRGDRTPAFISPNANIKHSIISPGCYIAGELEYSVLSPGVTIEEGSKVTKSVIFHDCFIGRNAKLDHVVMDKNVVVGDETVIGFGNDMTPNERYPSHLVSGITIIGKNAHLRQHIKIRRNCLVVNSVKSQDFYQNEYYSGSTISPQKIA